MLQQCPVCKEMKHLLADGACNECLVHLHDDQHDNDTNEEFMDSIETESHSIYDIINS